MESDLYKQKQSK